MQLDTPLSTQFKSEFFTDGHGNRQQRRHQAHARRRHRPQVCDGYRGAALRAYTAAQLVLQQGYSVGRAARCCGANRRYVYAMLTILATEDGDLLLPVLTGGSSVPGTAARVKNAATAIAAYKKCSAYEKWVFRNATGVPEDLLAHLCNSTDAELAAAGKSFGIDTVWDTMIVPSMPVSETVTELTVT
jgi:hypothetical protein